MSAVAQSVTPEIIVEVFEILGGDPESAAESARTFSSVDTWKNWQAAQAAVAGGAAVALPVAHLPLIAADLLFLMHKMAYCCWGVGAKYGCEIESKEDFGVILGMYAGVVTKDALVASAGTGVLTLAGGAIANAGLPAFISKVVGKGASAGAVSLGSKLAVKGLGKGVGKALATTAPLIGAISGKLAEKLTAKFVTKAAIKAATNAIAGFLPIVGIAAGGAINAYFVRRIASCAEDYYSFKKSQTGK